MTMKKIVAFITVVVVLLVCAVSFVANGTPKIVGYDTYVVAQGDTLWDIAKLSNGYDDMDTRDVIYDIKQASNITSDIQLGDVVQIPIYEED